MLVADLRKLLKKYNEEELKRIIVEMYKSMPKKLKEDQNIDLMLEDIVSYFNVEKTLKAKEPKVDFISLSDDIELFVEYAYNQYYFAPNSYVHKKDRPKWRFIVKDFFKELQTIPCESDEGKTATKLMVDLFKMLSHASRYYLFNTDDPFRSIAIEKNTIIDMIIKRKLYTGVNTDSIRESIEVTVLDSEYYSYTLLNNLNTPDAKLMAIEQCKILKKEYKSALPGKKDYIEYVQKERINGLVQIVTILYIDLFEYEEAEKYIFENYSAHDKETTLYVLLSHLESFNLPDIWIKVYEKGIKLKPRKRLQEKYAYIKEKNEFQRYE